MTKHAGNTNAISHSSREKISHGKCVNELQESGRYFRPDGGTDIGTEMVPRSKG